jgi:hypothetical protein
MSARQFYLKDLRDNLIEPMSTKTLSSYKMGSGNELDDKMRALRSSSAMTYNLLGNTAVKLRGNERIDSGTYAVTFEKQLHTLRKGEGGHPANLDAFLYCAQLQEAVACEMKLMEWLFKPGKLRSAYLSKKNYDDEPAASVFISVAQNLIAPAIDYEGKLMPVTEYCPVMQRYDAFQIFKHALACYNECQKNPLALKKLTLLNCVWELPCPERLSCFAKQKYQSYEDIEHQEFADFYRATLPIRQIFAGIGVDFDICYYSLPEFLSLIEKDATSIRYLNRYTFAD